MQIYAIFGAQNVPALEARIPAVFGKNYRVGHGQWLVAYQASLPADVYQAMKNQGGDINCIIVQLTQYYGWQDKAVWDWIEAAARGA
jgi:hypothetical protein